MKTQGSESIRNLGYFDMYSSCGDFREGKRKKSDTQEFKKQLEKAIERRNEK